MAMIHEAICATMNDVGAVTKGDFNTYDKYKFRGIDAVMNALNPAMRKNGIFVVPEVLEHHQDERQSQKGGLMIYTTCKVKYTFYAKDGSSLDAVVVGEAMDRSDKSTNKAMSAAFKYACFQTFCIPTEEMQDADSESPTVKPKDDRTGEPAYPPRNEMLASIKKWYQIEKLLTAYRIDDIEKLDDAQVMALYNNGVEKLKQKEKK